MWVKICANTCVEDALEAARLGADAVGFVFAPSSRQVTAKQVREIARELPRHVERVGVFGAGSVEDIAAAAEQAELNTIQTHGGVDLALAQRLADRLGAAFRIIETLHWTVGADAAAAATVREQMASVAADPGGYRVLVDARVGMRSGGTGQSFDWDSAREVLGSQPGLRVIVAGGLRPENVAQAVRTLRPWGVDVASGVEREPGRKDYAKLQKFIANARSEDGATG